MASIYTNEVDTEAFTVKAYNYKVNANGGDCIIWYEPGDDDVIRPVAVSFDDHVPLDGMVLEVTIASNGFLVRQKSGSKQSQVASEEYGLKRAIMELAHRVEERRVPFDPSHWEDVEEDLRQVQLKLNVADKAEVN